MLSFERQLDLVSRDDTTIEDDRTFSQHMAQVASEVRRVGERMAMRDAVGECVAHVVDELSGASLLKDDEWPFMEELMHAACRHVEEAYRWISGELGIVVDLVIHENAKPRVGASTRFPAQDDVGHRHAVVVLQLPEQFKRQDYFSLLAMLHHEVFVHVVQSPGVAGPRQAVGDKCFLAEGMMDALGYRLYMRDIDRHLGRALVQYANEFRNKAMELHGWRFAQPSLHEAVSNDLLIYEARRRGRDVLDRAVAARRIPDAEDWAAMVAMRLNLASLTTEQRRRALMHIDSGLRAPQLMPGSMLGTLSAIAEGEDVATLLRL